MSGPNLDKKCAQLSGVAPSQENYFVVKPIKKGLNRVCWNFSALFCKKCPFLLSDAAKNTLD